MHVLEDAIRTSVPAKIEENVKAALHAYEMTTIISGVNDK